MFEVIKTSRLGAEARELTSEEELCYLILVSGGSCNVQWDGQTTLAAPGCALLLGPGSGRLDRKSTRLNSSHYQQSRMPSSA